MSCEYQGELLPTTISISSRESPVSPTLNFLYNHILTYNLIIDKVSLKESPWSEVKVTVEYDDLLRPVAVEANATGWHSLSLSIYFSLSILFPFSFCSFCNLPYIFSSSQ